MTDGKDIINISEAKTVDVSQLDEKAKQEIKTLIAKQNLELRKKGMEQRIDVEFLRSRLNTFGDQLYDVIDKGGSITITNTKDDSIGRTEVIMGNTEEAAKGKLSRSAKGLADNTKWIVIGAIVVAVIAILAFSGN